MRGDTPPATATNEDELLALANTGRLFEIYKDRPDEEKIAIVSRLANLPETDTSASSYERGPIMQALKLVMTLDSLDLRGARVVLGFAATSARFRWYLDFPGLVRFMERQPKGTYHDDELRHLFEHVKRGEWWYRRLDGLDITRRLQATLGIPEREAISLANATANDAELDTWMDTWVGAWMQLADAVRTANDDITSALRALSRDAIVAAAANPEAARGRNLMNLEEAGGEALFRERRPEFCSGQKELRTFDRAWLADMREQEAAWRKLGPMPDWSRSGIPGLTGLSAIRVGPEQTLVEFLRTLCSAIPGAAWTKRAAALAAGPQGATIRRAITEWLGRLEVSGLQARARLWAATANYRRFRERMLANRRVTDSAATAALLAFFDADAPWSVFDDGRFYVVGYRYDPGMLSEVAALLVRSTAWMLASWRDAETAATLRRTIELTLLKPDDRGIQEYRSLAAANACILALGTMATPEAIQALGRIRLAVRDRRVLKQIDKAMELAARSGGMSVADIEELAVPTFELDAVGAKAVMLGELTVTLRVESTTAVKVVLSGADGTVVKALPASIRADPATSAELKRLKATAKSVAQALPVHRQRIELLYLTRRTWPFAVWRERFLDHPLVGTLARRLIWTVTNADGKDRSLIWQDDRLVDAAGTPAGLRDDDVVALWHPLDASADEVAAWQAYLMRQRVVQPFKQAHREIYPLTKAERSTGAYSNRFAGHILRQHQAVTLARLRGWRATFLLGGRPSEEPCLHIPASDLAAELWIAPAGDQFAEDVRDQAYSFISTDRVRFRRLGANGMLGDPVALDTVPPRVFSEVMRDADLFVGVASIGNDPTWIDAGADAAHPAAWRHTAARDYWTRHSMAELDVAGESRKNFLAGLIPSLAIAGCCTLTDRHLEVRGNLRTYRIHLGSGNILMEANRYLCVVPESRKENAADFFLPFEGDRMLSIILSKALMLAADDKITDPGIVSQLRS
jgi:hypothetical protein